MYVNYMIVHSFIGRLQIDQNEHDINVLEGALEKVTYYFLSGII